MATSTLTDRLFVNNPKVLEEWVKAMEKGANEPPAKDDTPIIEEITDPEEIHRMITQYLEKWGKKKDEN